MAFVKVADQKELDEGAVLGVHAEGKAICVVRLDGEVYAFADNCSHRDFQLSNGEIEPEDCSITCEWHGARFDIRSGKALSLPATRPIPVYPCKSEPDGIYVDVG